VSVCNLVVSRQAVRKLCLILAADPRSGGRKAGTVDKANRPGAKATRRNQPYGRALARPPIGRIENGAGQPWGAVMLWQA
jgi:hypothetical protein